MLHGRKITYYSMYLITCISIMLQQCAMQLSFAAVESGGCRCKIATGLNPSFGALCATSRGMVNVLRVIFVINCLSLRLIIVQEIVK